MTYRTIDILDWAEDLEGKRITRALPRRAGGITILTLEVEGGALFDLMIGDRSCQSCGQRVTVPNFFVPAERSERREPSSPSYQNPYPSPPIQESPWDSGEDDEEEEELWVEAAPSPQPSRALVQLTKAEFEARLQQQTDLQSTLNFLAGRGHEYEVIDD